MQKASGIFALILLSIAILGCSEGDRGVVLCKGSATQGSVWISISMENEVRIGHERFSIDLLKTKHNLVSSSCDSVIVHIASDKAAKHSVVFETIESVKNLGYSVSM